jgi:hypothetical protein
LEVFHEVIHSNCGLPPENSPFALAGDLLGAVGARRLTGICYYYAPSRWLSNQRHR